MAQSKAPRAGRPLQLSSGATDEAPTKESGQLIKATFCTWAFRRELLPIHQRASDDTRTGRATANSTSFSSVPKPHTSPFVSRRTRSFHPLSSFTIFTMRWLPIFLSLALPFGSLAAKKSASVDRFEEYHTKAVSSYVPLKLDDKAYKQLTTAPRDYTAAVLLTAMGSRFGCQLCREFQPEWELLAKSWTKGDKKGESRLVFGTLDFADGRETFVSVRRACWL